MPEDSKKNRSRYVKKDRSTLSITDYVKGIRNGDRSILAKAITLIESRNSNHFKMSQQILKEILPFTGNSMRIGITGVPGAGKSTFIERFGTELCNKGRKVAVLAIDPTSTISKGSILGDKTRMENLSREPNAFIRPSPTNGALGGVHRKTRETILLCEAAGFDTIFVETVGVGQNEVVVRTMVDLLMMLTITGAGDELQGMKKGMMELCDMVLVTKADGSNKQKAIETKSQYNKFLHLLKPVTRGWIAKAFTCSAVTGEGIPMVWKVIQKFFTVVDNNGYLMERRNEQTKEWLRSSIMEQLEHSFFQNKEVMLRLPLLESKVTALSLPVSTAVEQLLELYFHEIKKI
ncbi:methylmalonyl Co-A mutase-associated GTPase MeaB [Caldibacillus lycopersici]|uniref:Methylmalonyl Co-A mutase-associated GTPase MeaB n=1 Tax=Perspicuibacillus lycopersici TaxID=1325689 RepID=A0AAE3LNG0_9BACI|nr:methylmalonyl Co-A mutase-associated GTPase MeaB [Perspicuibacillus lycopersici]MCU9613812.1 methylmalonyl Co-A mutase-associated GTPase MeaB [Perspicuibacillus lycopersici]